MLAEEGFDPAFGARPLKRLIQRSIIDPMSIRLLAGDFHAGDCIRVSLVAGSCIFDVLKGGGVVGAESEKCA